MTASDYPSGTVLTGPNGETYTVGQRGRKPLWVISNSYKVGKVSRKIGKRKVANCKKVSSSNNFVKLKFLSSKNIADLKEVSNDFSYLLSTLSASDKGKICETAFKLALFMRIPIKNLPKDISLYENNEKVLRINDIGFGTKSGGVDITVKGH